MAVRPKRQNNGPQSAPGRLKERSSAGNFWNPSNSGTLLSVLCRQLLIQKLYLSHATELRSLDGAMSIALRALHL
jgi:hypothetical protein